MLKPRWLAFSVSLLLVLMFAEMFFSVRRESVTWDEGDHLFAGYMSLRTHDFGYNPEHPPLPKMIGALPLLPLRLRVSPDQGRFFKTESYMDGRELLFRNGPLYTGQQLMLRARMAMMLFPLALALLVFFAGREMFGPATGLLALALLAFEPNILTHGPLVTTDAAISCMCMALVWTAYRYAIKPSPARLVILGLVAGLTLAAKHSGVVFLVALGLAFLGDLIWRSRARKHLPRSREAFKRDLLVFVGGYLATLVIATVVLWAFYGFRFASRPHGLALAPDLAHYVIGLRPLEAKGIVLAGRWHLLPESWLYGLADVRQVANGMQTYLFGRIYEHGLWRYFPVLMLIKLTLGSLALIVLAAFALARGWLPRSRSVWYLLFPAAFYFYIAMGSGLNIGVRHVLPCIPLLLIFAAAGALALSRRGRGWAIAVTVLVAAHVVSSARAFPLYLPYANEAWGGPANTWRYLSDSNTDWGQQLPQVADWVRAHQAEPTCRFAYFVAPFILPSDYGIPCPLLPTPDSSNMIDIDMAPTFTGTLIISSADLNGFEWGTRVRNPYQQIVGRKPDAVIDDGVFVFRGTFDLRDAAAVAPTQRAIVALHANDTAAAISQARKALLIAPRNFDALFTLGQALAAAHDTAGANQAWRQALVRVDDMEPSAQQVWRARIAGEEAKLSSPDR